MKTFGVVLLILGILMTAITGFTVVTRKKVVDMGKIEINKEEKTPIYWSPLTGGIMVIAGIFVVLATKKK